MKRPLHTFLTTSALCLLLFVVAAAVGHANDVIKQAGGTVLANEAGTAVTLKRNVEYGPFGQPTVVADAKLTPAVVAELQQIQDLVALSIPGQKMIPELLAALPELTSLRALNLKSSGMTNDGLAKIASLKHLEVLNLEENRKLTDEGLQHLKGLTKLRRVELRSARVTDKGLLVFKDHKNLQSLKLRYTDVTGAGLVVLENHPQLAELELQCERSTADRKPLDLTPLGRGFAALKILSIGGNKLTDDHVAAIAKLPKLERLSMNTIGFLEVTNEGAKQLGQMKSLKHINLNGATKLDDIGVKALCENPALESLDLRRTGVTSASADAIAALPNLKEINLASTRFDPAGVKVIRAKHPKAKITLHQIMH